MSELIATIEPWIVGLGLVYWEFFIGWCVWASMKSEMGRDHGFPVSGAEVEPVNRTSARGDAPVRTWTGHVPSTSA